MTRPNVSGRVYNVACGDRVTVLGLVHELEAITGIEARLDHVEPRPGDVRDSLADISQAREALGYSCDRPGRWVAPDS